jgi:hypothetical protein
MSDSPSSRPGGNGSAEPFSSILPVAGYALWGPALAGAVKWNGKMYEGFAMLGSEWLDFVNRRLKEDMDWPQRLYASRSPEEVRQAYVGFWQQAVDDYQKEFGVMTRLVGSLVSNSLAAARGQVEESARETGRSYSKAA